jgi:hypothetical protein
MHQRYGFLPHIMTRGGILLQVKGSYSTVMRICARVCLTPDVFLVIFWCFSQGWWAAYGPQDILAGSACATSIDFSGGYAIMVRTQTALHDIQWLSTWRLYQTRVLEGGV